MGLPRLGRVALMCLALAGAASAPISASVAQSGAPQSAPPQETAAQVATEISHGLSAFGDLKYPVDFTHFDYVDPDAPKGGALRLNPATAIQTFDSFNPFILKGLGAAGVVLLNGRSLIYDSLMVRAFDEPDALYGLIAEKVELPADRSFVVFHLNPAARFADGSPVTADDVVWSLEAMRDRTAPRFALAYRDVAEVTALDEARVRVDFRPEAPKRNLAAIVAQAPIFPRAWFETRDFEEPSLEPPLGSGPYEVASFRPGQTVTYARRDDYWARDLPVNRGQFNFDSIKFEYFANPDAALAAFRVGEIDFIEEFSSKIWSTQYDFAEIQSGLIVKEVLPDGRPSGTQGFWINTRKDKFADPRVREALAMVFDFEWSNEKLFFNLYNRTDSFFENSDLEAFGAPSAAELALLEPYRAELPTRVFDQPVSPPVTDGSGRIRRQIAAAGRLLTEAGWAIGADGLRRNAAGGVLEIEFLDRTGSGFERIVSPYIANLERLGVQASFRAVDRVQYETRIRSFDFDVVARRFAFEPTPGSELQGLLSSASAGQPGSSNLAGVDSPVVDGLLSQIEGAPDRDALQAAGRALDRVFRAGHYWVPHWNKASHNIAYWDRFGRPFADPKDKVPYMRGVVLTWWADPAKSAAIDAAQGR